MEFTFLIFFLSELEFDLINFIIIIIIFNFLWIIGYFYFIIWKLKLLWEEIFFKSHV